MPLPLMSTLAELVEPDFALPKLTMISARVCVLTGRFSTLLSNDAVKRRVVVVRRWGR